MKNNDSYHILIVDDDPNVLSLTALVLQKAGYSITPVLGGEAALDALDRSFYDLVITDLNMPGADGEDVLRKARENQPQAPVIIMTGNPHQLGVQCGVGGGPDIVLEKPFNLTDLLSSLEGCLSPCAS